MHIVVSMLQGLIRTCSICDNDDPSTSHPPEAMFDIQTDGSTSPANLSTWWQSVTWYHVGGPPDVTITLSFGKTFQLQDDIEIVFTSARPQQMVLEKSVDNGQTWSTLQYYRRSCTCVTLLQQQFTTTDKLSPRKQNFRQTRCRRSLQL